MYVSVDGKLTYYGYFCFIVAALKAVIRFASSYMYVLHKMLLQLPASAINCAWSQYMRVCVCDTFATVIVINMPIFIGILMILR